MLARGKKTRSVDFKLFYDSCCILLLIAIVCLLYYHVSVVLCMIRGEYFVVFDFILNA
jgi:hypothetical protein